MARAPARERTRWLDRPRNVQRLLRGLYTLCGVLIGIDAASALLHALGSGELRHAERRWEGVPGFYPIYGFAACVLLVLIAKQLRRVLMRREQYYDDDA